MKQKHADSPSAFLAAAMAVTGAAMLLCPLIGQNTEMNRSAAEYDDLRVQLKSEEPAQATDAPAQDKRALRVLLGFPSATQEPLELPEQDGWAQMEQFCQMMSHQDDIWYATNIEIVDALEDAARLQFTVDGDLCYNPNAASCWVSVGGKIYELPGGTTTRFE